MLDLTLHPVELPLRHAWTIAHGTRTVQRNLIVELHDHDTGLSGYGEAAAIPYFGVTVEAMCKLGKEFNFQAEGLLEDAVYGADGSDSPSGSERWAYGVRQNSHDPNASFYRCALDQAVWDLWGKLRGITTRSVWSTPEAVGPPSNYTLGMAAPEETVAKLREFPEFPVYKIKLGTGSPETDLQLVERLRQETDAAFRVDANTAWSAEEAIRLSGPLQELGVEFIEQPLKRDLPRSEHEAVYSGSDLPIMADESCITEDDVDRCAGCFHGINIKLTKCGGLTPARRMIGRARERGLKVMVGCMTETTVGISAIGQLLPLLDYVDMDGALLLAEDVADGVKVGPDGRAAYPETAGNGVTLTRDLPSI
jgi:L-alanine-DL-glutamate epimerase-like enolase superfamily enzyme